MPNHETIHYCGLAMTPDGETFMFLPRNTLSLTTSNYEEKIDAARNTMAALVRFARETDRAALGKAEGVGGILAPVIEELAQDYRDYGIYLERLRVESRNTGKPNWKKTLVKGLPYPISGGMVYIDYVSSKPVRSQDNILALIQSVIISEIYQRHSWWLGVNFGKREDLLDTPKICYPREQWIKLLQQFMRGLYSDRSLRLVHSLCTYLKAESQNSKGIVFCGLRDFHTVWETMLRDVITDVEYGWATKLPRPNYVAWDGSANLSAGMMPDIIVRSKNGLLIVDAKYYAASSVENSPKLGDILKQISYLHAVSSVEKEVVVKTCFVFPREKNTKGNYSHVMFEDRNGTTSDVFPRIECYYFPILEVMDAYIVGNHLSFETLAGIERMAFEQKLGQRL
jgi:hypothetical protein